MKKLFIFLSLLLAQSSFSADVKISALPLGTASTTTSSDSFPFVSSAVNLTKRLTLWDLINLPPIVSTYAPKASPTFTGVVTAPSFVGPLTGNASTATALAANPTDCSSNQYANAIAANGNLTCAQPSFSQLTGTNAASQGGTGQDMSAATGVVKVSSGTFSAASLVNADVSSSAAIARSKIATGTLNQVVINDGSTGALSGISQLDVPKGGTGLATLTANNVILGNGTSTPLFVAPGSSGNLLTSNGSTWLSSAPSATIFPITTKTANYTTTVNDYGILLDASGGSFTLTLLAAASANKQAYLIKKIDSSTNTVTISGLSKTLYTKDESFLIVSDGSTWNILQHLTDTSWTSYSLSITGSVSNPTKGTVVTDAARWRRSKDSMDIEYDYVQSAGGSDGSGTYLFSIPSGYTIDSGRVTISTDLHSGVVGSATSYDRNAGFVKIYDTTHLALAVFVAGSSTNNFVTSTYSQLSNAAQYYNFKAVSIPITGWDN